MKLFSALIFAFFTFAGGSEISEVGVNNSVQQLPEVHGDRFYYFGFGSNMLAKRIHIQYPTAVIVGPALLRDYRLDFTLPNERWKGAAGTVVPGPGKETWGTLWEIDLSNLPDIDNQEGVHLGYYRPVSVQVKHNSTDLLARLYMTTNVPKGNVHDMPRNEVPEDRQPSKTYLQVLVKGAIESGIPDHYVNLLKGFKHNNQTVKDFEERLELQSVEL